MQRARMAPREVGPDEARENARRDQYMSCPVAGYSPPSANAGRNVTATLTIRDETATGEPIHEFPLEFADERITVRELIRERVYQEVTEYNFRGRREGGVFRGLVHPGDAERALNGVRIPKHREIDWEAQFERAIDAFGRNGFFILVDDRQAEALDETIVIGAATQVSFVKLTPLVGG
jgi:hypothetical protein